MFKQQKHRLEYEITIKTSENLIGQKHETSKDNAY
jgi:hypothetical protein